MRQSICSWRVGPLPQWYHATGYRIPIARRPLRSRGVSFLHPVRRVFRYFARRSSDLLSRSVVILRTAVYGPIRRPLATVAGFEDPAGILAVETGVSPADLIDLSLLIH